MVLANYIKINPNLDKPSKKATIRTKQILKQLSKHCQNV